MARFYEIDKGGSLKLFVFVQRGGQKRTQLEV